MSIIVSSTVRVNPCFNIHETLASILKELNYDTTATYRLTPEYLKKIYDLTNCFIIIDEANDLDRRVWPYLKRIIDAGVPIVFAGLPKVRTFLTSKHPAILSRLKTLVLYPIVAEDFTAEYNDIVQEYVPIAEIEQKNLSILLLTLILPWNLYRIFHLNKGF